MKTIIECNCLDQNLIIKNKPTIASGGANEDVKVLWKLIAAVSSKNVWPMFVQMRILMPIGFLILLAALIADRANLSWPAMLAGLTGFPACIFFGTGALGMALMFVFAFRMDSSDPKVNWLEQGINGIAQLCFFLGLLLV